MPLRKWFSSFLNTFSLLWRHNGHDGVSNHQPHDCLLNCLFRYRSKQTPKLRVTGLCEGNSPVTGEFPTQRASNEENVYIWWRHHVMISSMRIQHGIRWCLSTVRQQANVDVDSTLCHMVATDHKVSTHFHIRGLWICGRRIVNPSAPSAAYRRQWIVKNIGSDNGFSLFWRQANI